MKSVRIKADLEKDIRAILDPNNGGVANCSLLCEHVVKELVKLLDADKPKAASGMGYRELVGQFRACFGAGLALPPNPSVGWIARQVVRAKDLGLDHESIQRLSDAAKRLYPRPPYDFEWLLRAAPRLLAGSAGSEGVDSGGGHGRGVYTGRGAQDDDV